MGHLRKRALRWAAPLTLVAVAGLAACGDDGDGATTRTAGAASATMGSDVHLENLASDIAARSSSVVGSDVHLQNLADEIGARSEAEPSGTVAAAAAQAAASEQDAHMAGNAATYGADGPSAPSEPSDDEFVPGTRHMPVR
ncbi:MAG TPA: hypothetical protein VJM49_02170 [Acidimicrobiales bacterium]|nr:hypothetical protein [Acidimicrobiales bacterium]